MIDLIVKILQNFSVYKLGWYSKGFEKMGLSPSNIDNWEMLAIIVVVFLGILTLVNIIYFLMKSDDVYLKVYGPLCIFYIIQNIISHLFLFCLFFSLGPIMWIILSSIYVIFLFLFSAIYADEYEIMPGFFKLMLFTITYSKRWEKYAQHKERITDKYQHFLNIKYEK
jgi:hypothetical protein